MCSTRLLWDFACGFRSFDRLVKVASISPSLDVLVMAPPRSHLARHMKQRPYSGLDVVGLDSTCPHVWLGSITVLPLAIHVTILAHCLGSLGVGIPASAPVRKEISVATLLSAHAHVVHVAHLPREEMRFIRIILDVKLCPFSHRHSYYMPYLLY